MSKPELTKQRQVFFLGNGVDPPKRKHPTFWMNLVEYFSEYTGATSLHAFQYLGERKRSIVEKIWWFLCICASLYTCMFLIVKTYEKWNNAPVIVSFAQTPTQIHKIPFPAVTICSETKARQRVYNFTDCYHRIKTDGGVNVTLEERKKFEAMALLCDPYLYPEGENTTSVNVTDFMAHVAPNFLEALWQCKWTNVNESCDHMFTTSLSEEGICFTANMLDRDEIFTNEVFHNKEFLQHGRDSFGWTIDNGYLPGVGTRTYPRRALSAGAKAGLTILLRAFEPDLDYLCRGPVQGFKVILHHPAEVPRVSMQFIRVPLDQEMIIIIKPEMMKTSVGLQDYNPKIRGCYFQYEKQLRFYKRYTQQSCQVECLTNITLKLCGCVSYHMPHTEDTKICGSGKIHCMQEAQIKIVSDLTGDAANRDSKVTDCECLPSCTSLTYNMETSQAEFDWVELFQAFKQNFSEFPGLKMARLQLYFKELQFITLERNELYGITNFLASCGGLLGLFIGFSFLSLIEVMYFLSIRLWANIIRFGRYFWSASEDLLNSFEYTKQVNLEKQY